MRILTSCLLVSLSAVSCSYAFDNEPTYVHTAAGGRSWTIGNETVEKTITFSGDKGLSTSSWIHKITGTDFMKQPFDSLDAQASFSSGHEFSFVADGRRIQGSGPQKSLVADFTGSRVEDLPRSGQALVLSLRVPEIGLSIDVSYAVYPHLPVIRKWLSIRNTSSRAVILSHLAMEDVTIRAASPDKQAVYAGYGVEPREIFYTGRAEDTAIVEENPKTREGFVLMNEVPGWLKRTDLLNWGQAVSLMYDTDLFPFERKIDPGKTFDSAKVDVAFFQEGGAEDPHWVVPTYASRILSKKGESFRSPWFYNTWEPFFQNYDASLVRSLIPIAAKMGLDIFTIDTGWSDDYASNEPSKTKFPEGLDGVRQELDSQGMRLGMWVPLAVVSADSQVYREHPDWVMRDYTGAEKTADFPGKNDRVMCLDSPYRAAAARRLNDLIDHFHPAYLKIDLTTVFNAYGEAPGCHAPGHYHSDWAQSLAGIYQGIQAVTNEIYAAHPDLILDLTFELWGQKHIIDYGLLAAGDLDWMSNVDDHSQISAGPLQARTLLYHRALAIPAETMLIGNLRATTPNIEERFATVIGSAPVLLGDLRKLKPDELSWYAEKIQWFKQLRGRLSLNEGFFPLGSWQQPNFDAWDGYARLSHSGEGIIVLFQNQSTDRVARFSIPAYPGGDFTLQPIVSKQGQRKANAQQLRSGIELPFASGHRVEIWQVCNSAACSGK